MQPIYVDLSMKPIQLWNILLFPFTIATELPRLSHPLHRSWKEFIKYAWILRCSQATVGANKTNFLAAFAKTHVEIVLFDFYYIQHWPWHFHVVNMYKSSYDHVIFFLRRLHDFSLNVKRFPEFLVQLQNYNGSATLCSIVEPKSASNNLDFG